MSAERRKFKDDSLLNIINVNFVSLKDEDMKRNNEILHEVLEEVVKTLKQKSEFFRDCYQKIIFAGSYYKGTKVGRPEEFDLNLVFKLPLSYELITFESDTPGFTKLRLYRDTFLPEWQRYKQFLAKLVTPGGYLDHDEFRRSFQSLLANVPHSVTLGNKNYQLILRSSGPAFTLYVKRPDSVQMCVDLVPVLEFSRLPSSFIGNVDIGSENWFTIPKAQTGLAEPHLQWRMSFYPSEKNMLKSYDSLKPVIRLLKKLRDTQGWTNLVSYHIETLVFHRIKTMDAKPEMRKYSLTEHFVDMLYELRTACVTRRIMNFWDKSHNLIANVNPQELANIRSRLETMIKEIERNPKAIVDFILTKVERSSIRNELRSF